MRRGRPRHPDVLTPREQQVLALLREGLTNAHIAIRLGISPDGAKYHVGDILSKSGSRLAGTRSPGQSGASVRLGAHACVSALAASLCH